MSTQGAGWKEKSTPGFGKFIDVLEAQAARLRSDLTALGDSLRAADDVYDQQDQEAGRAIDSAVRYE
ncbi:type VII secretion target [Mycobacterium sp. C31M]